MDANHRTSTSLQHVGLTNPTIRQETTQRRAVCICALRAGGKIPCYVVQEDTPLGLLPVKSGRPTVMVVSSSSHFVRELTTELSILGYAVAVLESVAALAAEGISKTVLCIAAAADDNLHPFTEVIALAKSYCCEAPIVALCSSPTIRMAVSLIKSGAIDVVEERNSPAKAALQIRIAASGAIPLSSIGKQQSAQLSPGLTLTGREATILDHVVSGRSSREIGELLGLSHRTIGGYRVNIMKKIGARNTPELVLKVLGTHF